MVVCLLRALTVPSIDGRKTEKWSISVMVSLFFAPGWKKFVIAVFMMLAVLMVNMEGVRAATCKTNQP
ncbi:hypothetical protein BJP36_41625 [Moorena producens JHB]|uniref:Uncharacterized protein n=1 Tax=Moorena producens (strain JHB) TaxID=1454205 RepID=A0A9Q9SSK5_MOOP1|nr:hypothetical protein [Moorena producens]WAN68865.1 hypothetical protein BJP36_41625 [Moorena producens JHB]